MNIYSHRKYEGYEGDLNLEEKKMHLLSIQGISSVPFLLTEMSIILTVYLDW